MKRLIQYLITGLFLWAGFLSTIHASDMYKILYENFINETDYIYNQSQFDAGALAQDACDDYVSNANNYFTTITYTCIGIVDYQTFTYFRDVHDPDGNDSYIDNTIVWSRSYDDPDNCTDPIFNPVTGRCNGTSSTDCAQTAGVEKEANIPKANFDTSNTFELGGCTYQTVGVSLCLSSQDSCLATISGTGNLTDGTYYKADNDLLAEPPTTANPTIESESDNTVTETDVTPTNTSCVDDGAGGQTCTSIDTTTTTTDQGNYREYFNDGETATITEKENQTVSTTETTTEIIYNDGSTTITKTTTINNNTGDIITTSYDGVTNQSSTDTIPGQATSTTTQTTGNYDTGGALTDEITTTDEQPAQEASADGYGEADLTDFDDYIAGIATTATPSETATPGVFISGSGTCTSAPITFRSITIPMDYCQVNPWIQSVLYWAFALMTIIYLYHLYNVTVRTT